MYHISHQVKLFSTEILCTLSARPCHKLEFQLYQSEQKKITEARYYQVSSKTFVLDKSVGRHALHRDVMVASCGSRLCLYTNIQRTLSSWECINYTAMARPGPSMI